MLEKLLEHSLFTDNPHLAPIEFEHNKLNAGIVPQFPKTLYTARGQTDANTIKEVKRVLNEFKVEDVNDI
jgi:hypothetical protein